MGTVGWRWAACVACLGVACLLAACAEDERTPTVIPPELLVRAGAPAVEDASIPVVPPNATCWDIGTMDYADSSVDVPYICIDLGNHAALADIEKSCGPNYRGETCPGTPTYVCSNGKDPNSQARVDTYFYFPHNHPIATNYESSCRAQDGVFNPLGL